MQQQVVSVHVEGSNTMSQHFVLENISQKTSAVSGSPYVGHCAFKLPAGQLWCQCIWQAQCEVLAQADDRGRSTDPGGRLLQACRLPQTNGGGFQAIYWGTGKLDGAFPQFCTCCHQMSVLKGLLPINMHADSFCPKMLRLNDLSSAGRLAILMEHCQ